MRISDWSSDVCSSDLLSPAKRSAENTAHCLHEADGPPAYLHSERPSRERANPPGEYSLFAISDFHRPIMLSFLTLSRLRKSKNARRTAAPIWRLTRIPRRGNHMHSRSDRAAILSPKRLLMGSALFSAFAFAPAVQAQSVPDPVSPTPPRPCRMHPARA